MIVRRIILTAALLTALGSCHDVLAAPGTGIIPETTATRHGLTRPWFTQIQMNRGRARVCDIVLYGGTLYVQTDRAMVHAVDAETGKTLWARQVGRDNHPSMTPGVGKDLLAVVNGSRLYVCNRYNGDLLYEAQVAGAPGAGAAVSDLRAYVPMVDGLVMAYRLESETDPMAELGMVNPNPDEEEKARLEEQRRENLRLRQEYIPALACQSFGKALVQPLVTRQTKDEEYVSWPTDLGYMNIAKIDRRQEDRFAIRYRLETGAGIAVRPTYLAPDPNDLAQSGLIFAASRDGFVYAVREKTGDSLWRFSSGEPIVQPAVVIAQRVYVATQPGGMYCLDAENGAELWWAPQVLQFVAASQQRVYAADRLGRILVLSAKTGARLDAIPVPYGSVKLINSDTDRIYLVSDTGLLQCLHEVEQQQPLRHQNARISSVAQQEPGQAQPGEQHPQQPPAGQQPGDDDPFAPPAGGGGDAGDPFGGGGGDPFGGNNGGGGNGGGDPFGGGNNGGGGNGGGDPFGGNNGGGNGGGDPFGGNNGGGGNGAGDPFGN